MSIGVLDRPDLDEIVAVEQCLMDGFDDGRITADTSERATNNEHVARDTDAEFGVLTLFSNTEIERLDRGLHETGIQLNCRGCAGAPKHDPRSNGSLRDVDDLELAFQADLYAARRHLAGLSNDLVCTAIDTRLTLDRHSDFSPDGFVACGREDLTSERCYINGRHRPGINLDEFAIDQLDGGSTEVEGKDGVVAYAEEGCEHGVVEIIGDVV